MGITGSKYGVYPLTQCGEYPGISWQRGGLAPVQARPGHWLVPRVSVAPWQLKNIDKSFMYLGSLFFMYCSYVPFSFLWITTCQLQDLVRTPVAGATQIHIIETKHCATKNQHVFICLTILYRPSAGPKHVQDTPANHCNFPNLADIAPLEIDGDKWSWWPGAFCTHV